MPAEPMRDLLSGFEWPDLKLPSVQTLLSHRITLKSLAFCRYSHSIIPFVRDVAGVVLGFTGDKYADGKWLPLVE